MKTIWMGNRVVTVMLGQGGEGEFLCDNETALYLDCGYMNLHMELESTEL